MALVTLNEVLPQAKKGHYALGAFDTMDFTLTEGICQASEQTGKPVILMFGGFSFDRADTRSILDFNLYRARRATTPIVYHLDHGSYEQCFRAIHAGASSVMFDGSALPMEENIEKTKRIVEAAHIAGVSVEAEIGHVAPSSGSVEGDEANPDRFTRVEDAVRFVTETGIDALAVAFGTVHGDYKGEPHLDLARLQAINDAVDVPLVMHGGSGLSDQDFKDAIAHGISKVNFFTALARSAMSGYDKVYQETAGKARYINFYDGGLEASVACVKQQMEIFGTPSIF